MRDQLPRAPNNAECGILNLQPSSQLGSHWVCWFKKGSDRYYFDSFGEPPPPELKKYLKTAREYGQGSLVIRQSSVTVQEDHSSECGSLCLFVLYHLSKGQPFSTLLSTLLKRYNQCVQPPLRVHGD